MSAMQIFLPDEIRAYIEEQVRSGHFESAGEMISALVQDARARLASKELCDFLDEGEKSEAIEYTDEQWQREIESLRARVLESRQQ